MAQALQVTHPETDMPIHDIEADTEVSRGFHPPDWTLLSPQGLMAVLQMAVTVFTKVGPRDFAWDICIIADVKM